MWLYMVISSCQWENDDHLFWYAYLEWNRTWEGILSSSFNLLILRYFSVIWVDPSSILCYLDLEKRNLSSRSKSANYHRNRNWHPEHEYNFLEKVQKKNKEDYNWVLRNFNIQVPGCNNQKIMNIFLSC